MYIVTAWFGFRTNHRLSRSPSLLISGSGSWPLREGQALALSLAFAAENIKNLPLALRAREKNLSSTCRLVWTNQGAERNGLLEL